MEWTPLHEKVLRITIRKMKKDAAERKNSNREFTISDFHLERVIGRGRFGCVWLAKHINTGLYFAIKSVERELVNKHDICKEVFLETLLHSRIEHPNIIQFYGHFIDSKGIYFIQDFACNGSLFANLKEQEFKRFSATSAAKYIYQTAQALMECHKKGFFHGDIKPENILLDQNYNVKLCDFGLSWPYILGGIRGLCGTKDYLAPEVLRAENYDQSIDLWGLGVLCFELLSGENPFFSKNKEVFLRRILDVDYTFPDIIEEDARDLIKKLLVKNPKERLPLGEVVTHGWIKKHYSEE